MNNTQTARNNSPSGSRRQQDPAPKIALVGCGAFAEVFYLPALARRPEVMSGLLLVDKDPARARTLATRFGAASYRDDYRAIVGQVDGAIVAVPHTAHFSITMDFLACGVPVLCEKPLSLCAEQACEMVDRADEMGVALATNHTQRLFPSNIKVRELLAAGAFGDLTHLSYTWGAEFTWPTVSGFYFNEAISQRRGVLADRGPHAFDLICWWLGEKPQIIAARHDSLGGLEAVAHVTLRAGDCTIDIHLSWLSKLTNSYTIRGTVAEVHNSFEAWWKLPLRYHSGETETLHFASSERSYNDFAPQIVDNFISVVCDGAAPLIPARDVLPSLELIDMFYTNATPFSLPWYAVERAFDVYPS
ncbi:MAG: Gfo/Idh/MocA family oxidoreductase [Chloroflexi bacterium]|nr:Gfo/Idh/MocA family oxidoreductase [Chloroflexota bacterium]